MVSWLKRRVRPLISRVLFERRLGVDTSRTIASEQLGYRDARQGFYEPAEWHTLQRILPRRSVGADDVFVDVGSGMGRMVLRAAQYPFKRVIGVELSHELHEIAERNLDVSIGQLRCRDVRFEQADALDYELPDDVTVVFLNNPFRGEIFDAAIESILRSVDRRPRRLRIIYRNPVEHERLVATGRARLDAQWWKGAWRRRPKSGVAIHRYEVLGRADDGDRGGDQNTAPELD